MSLDEPRTTPPVRPPNLQIYGTVRDSYSFIFSRKLRLIWSPAVLGALIVVFEILQELTGQLNPLHWLFLAGKICVVALLLPPLQRRILGIEDTGQPRAKTILIYVALIAAFQAITAPWDIVTGQDHGSLLYLAVLKLGVYVSPVAVMIAGVIYTVVTFYVLIRFMPATAMAAIGKLDLSLAWRLTHRNFWPIIGACILITLPIFVGMIAARLAYGAFADPQTIAGVNAALHGDTGSITLASAVHLVGILLVVFALCWLTGLLMQLLFALHAYIYRDRMDALTREPENGTEASAAT